MQCVLPLVFTLLLALPGCNMVGGSVGVGTGSGMGISFSSYGDFLYSGNGETYANNRRGLKELLNKDYFAAREIFKASLEMSPGNPDATYYLGLTFIYLDERAAGYSLLSQYRDPFKIRIAQEVHWWANYCSKKPDLTPEKIHRVMNNARTDGYQRDREEEWDRRKRFLGI